MYAEPYDPRRPVVCFDETSTQLLADTRPPLPTQPGRPARQDFAHQMRWLVDEAYPEVPVVRVVLANLNTHRMASLYQTSRRRRPGGLRGGWSFTTPPSTAVGSILS